MNRARYPFADTIHKYAAVVHDQMLYLFGGLSTHSGGNQSTIAQYNPSYDTWKKVGDLNRARCWHDAVFSQGAFLIVGMHFTEKCELNGGNMMDCVRQEPEISR